MKTKFQITKKLMSGFLAAVLSLQTVTGLSGQIFPSVQAVSSSEEGGGSRIEDIRVSWVTAQDNKENLHVEKNDRDPFSTKIRVDAALSGQYPYSPGTVQITLPRQIWKDRQNQSTGVMTFSIPEAPEDRGQFQYSLQEDSIIVTNTRSLPAASSIYFELAVEELDPLSIKDKQSGCKTEAFYAQIEVAVQDGTTISRRSNEIFADLDTESQVVVANTRAWRTYLSWPEEWPVNLKPANAEQYVYVDWYSWCYTAGSQVYNLSFRGDFDDPSMTGEMMLGQSGLIHEQNFEQESRIFGSTGGVHTYMAYPCLQKDDEGYLRVHESVCYTLEDADDKKQTSAVSQAEAVFNIEDFTPPSGHFEAYKFGGNQGIFQDHTRRLDIPDYAPAVNKLAMGQAVDFDYKVDVTGFGWPWTLRKDWQQEMESRQEVIKDHSGRLIPDENCYGYRDYQMVVEDHDAWFNEENNGKESEAARLDPHEYEYRSLSIEEAAAFEYVRYESAGYGYRESNWQMAGSVVEQSEIDAGQWGYRETENQFPEITIYGQTRDGSWIEMAVYSRQNGFQAKGSARAEGDTLTFPSGIIGYKAVLSTKTAAVLYTIYPTVRVFGSERIAKQCQQLLEKSSSGNPVKTSTSGCVSLDVLDQDGAAILSLDCTNDEGKKGTDTLISASQKVQMKKTISDLYNDTVNRLVEMTYTGTVYIDNNLQEMQDYKQAVAQNVLTEVKHGYFYDLLPAGVTPLTDTVKVREKDSVRNIQLLENWKDSGRTLMIAEVDLSPDVQWRGRDDTYGEKHLSDRPFISFKARYTWESLGDYGRDLENNIAFEADGLNLGTVKKWKGEPDDPTAGNHAGSKKGAGTAAGLLTGLNDSRKKQNQESSAETDSFVYAKVNRHLNQNILAVSSLSKAASVNKDGIYNDGLNDASPRNVYAGGTYTYRLRMETTAANRAKDIIFYDSLEAYIPGSENIETGAADKGDKQWKGTFRSVDISQLRSMGIDPVIYYSTRSGLVLDDTDNRAHNDLNDHSIWQTALPEDLSKVTAVAIDCSKAVDGSDYILPSSSSIAAFVKMQAPADVPQQWMDTALQGRTEADDDGLAGGAHAYNNAVEIATLISGTVQAKDQLIRHDYTKVGLAAFPVHVKKEWDDDNDRDGLRPDSIVVELLAGGQPVKGKSAVLSEENGWSADFGQTSPCDENGNPLYFSVRESGSSLHSYRMKTEARVENGQMRLCVTNIHTPETTEISGVKRWKTSADANPVPSSIEIQLLADGKPLSGVQTAHTDASLGWAYSFTDLPRYKNHGQKIRYTVQEAEYIPGYAAKTQGNDLMNEWSPYGNLVLSKQVKNRSLAGAEQSFEFLLRLTEEDGTVHAGKYAYTTSDGRKGTAESGSLLSLQDGQTITVENIRSEVKWSLEEQPVKGYSPEKQLLEGVIRAGQTSQASFVNTYAARIRAVFQAEKILEGRFLQAARFRFTLKDNNGQIVSTGVNRAGDPKGQILFNSVVYTEKDSGKTFEYRMEEENGHLPGYSYDKTIWTVKATPTDKGDGTMDLDIRYFDENGQEISGLPVFRNRYHAEKTVDLTVFKRLEGLDLQKNQFEFVLKTDKGKEVARARNNEDGMVVFPLVFTEKDSDCASQESTGDHILYAQEVNNEIDGIIYDERQLKFTVHVHDTGSGTLEVAYTYDPQPEGSAVPVFINRTENGTLRVSKTTIGEWAGYDPNSRRPGSGVQFRYKVKFSNLQGIKDEDIQIRFGSAEDPLLTETPWLTTPPQEEAKSGIIYVEVVDETPDNGVNDNVMYIRCASTEEEQRQLQDLFAHYGQSFWGGRGVEDSDNLMGGGKIGLADTNPQHTQKLPYSDSNITEIRVPERIRIEYEGGPAGMNYWFSDMMALKDIRQLSNLDVSMVTDMQYCFYRCYSLLSLNGLQFWDTSSLTNMYQCFAYSGLASLRGLENWDTGNVTNMSSLFQECENLRDAEAISGWDTSAVTNSMDSMFARDFGLTSLNVSGWDLSMMNGYAFLNSCSLQTIVLPPSTPSSLNLSGTWRHKKAGSSYTEPVSGSSIGSLIQSDPDGASGEWEAICDYLVFDPNSGYGSMPAVILGARGYSYYLPVRAFYKPGSTFSRWNTQPDGSGQNYSPMYGSFYNMNTPSGAVTTLYAIWNDQKIEIKNGEIEFLLRNGEYAEFPDLPAGTAYSVYEESTAGWRLIKESGSSGTISPAQTSSATFTNSKSGTQVSISLQALKHLDGKPSSVPFRFELSGDTLDTPVILTSDQTGSLSTDALVYKQAGTYSYQIRELADDPDRYEYDPKTVSVVVQVTSSYGNLSASVLYDGQTDIPVFENTAIQIPQPKKGKLTVRKTVRDTAGGAAWKQQDFSFRVSFSDGSVHSFSLKAGEEKTLENDAGVFYTVEELNIPAGYTSSISNAEGILSAGSEDDKTGCIADAVNTYSVSAWAVPVFKKEMDGEELKGNDFSFELNGEIDSEPVHMSAKNTSDGTIYFDPLEFTRIGTYDFKVREIAGTDENISYDSHEIDFSIEVSADPDNPGSLKCELIYGKDGKDDTFHNIAAVNGSLSIQKLLSGAGYMDDIHQSETFTMQIQLKQENGSAYTDSVTLRYGEETEHVVPDERGLLKVELSNMQTVVLEDLPAGISYSVTETDVPFALQQAAPINETIWFMSSSSRNLNGIIETGAAAEAVVINIPRGDEDPGDPDDHFCEETNTRNTFQTPLWS